MKYAVCLAVSCITWCDMIPGAMGQASDRTPEPPRRVSAGKAFAMSMAVPGLGQRYVHGGRLSGWASVFAAADAGLWVGLLGTTWKRSHLVDSYRTMAVRHAGIDPDGKGREFYLNLANYRSSDAFIDEQLRSRNWDRIGEATGDALQWQWDAEENFLLFRSLRSDAESLQRRRALIIAALAANRLIAGIGALRAAGRTNKSSVHVSFGPPPAGSAAPLLRLNVSL